ncbi:hypothetical protein ACFOQM_10560 [Paenibacillus sp. GCM10012307]|uniref:Uncharacterized protein n=1 Tax=Paenibacillus roseus TaxID=2798579 RepID=A0A934J1T5_9BACL|nr:hypothetical protein [Paenibacillus roseus]MBJ6361724.1 hypothetical protein [Paenibacillus roseus]
MSLNQEANRLSTNHLLPGLQENAPKRLDILKALFLLQITGNALAVVRTPALPDALANGFGTVIPDQTSMPDPQILFVLKQLATSYQVAPEAQDVDSAINNQKEIQDDLANRRLLYAFCRLLEVGDTTANPNEFDGFLKLVNPANVVDKAGATLTLKDLDIAKGNVRANNGAPIIITTNQHGYEAIRTAHYDAGITPEIVEFIPLQDGPAQKVMIYDGCPILINDAQPEHVLGGNPVTNIWFTYTGPNGLFGIVPHLKDGSLFRKRQVTMPDGSETVGQIFLPIGLALATESALAGITNIA